MGKPGFPPLAEGVGSRETVMRMAHNAAINMTGSAGGTPAPRLRGHGDRPCPDPPPPGAGTRRLPPAEGGWEGGGTLRTMVTWPHRAISTSRRAVRAASAAGVPSV